jgi:hypothetical protein
VLPNEMLVWFFHSEKVGAIKFNLIKPVMQLSHKCRDSCAQLTPNNKAFSESSAAQLFNNGRMQASLLQAPDSASLAPATSKIVDEKQPFATQSLKNVSRIDEIESRMSVEEIEVMLLSSWAIRTLKRDWNIVCSKMYVFGLDSRYKARIVEDLNELHWQVDDLATVTDAELFSSQDLSWLTPVCITLKVVSPQAASLLRAVRRWDLCMAKLLTAERTTLINKAKREGMLLGVNMAYLGFKGTAMKRAMGSTREMLQEENLI